MKAEIEFRTWPNGPNDESRTFCTLKDPTFIPREGESVHLNWEGMDYSGQDCEVLKVSYFYTVLDGNTGDRGAVRVVVDVRVM